MYESYKEIFNQRGSSYNAAMIDCPDARQNEFNLILELAEILEGHLVLDIPSGGGYLKNFIKPPVKIISVETSSLFIKDIDPTLNHSILLCNDISKTLLPDSCAERIISLAGLHHIEQRLDLYREMFRMVKPGGYFCMADAFTDSNVASFLNVFVNQYSSMGHRGEFLNEEDIFFLKKAGFKIIYDQIHKYTWNFKDVESMADYCQKLFGMNLADLDTIKNGIQEFIGYKLDNGLCQMNWELLFIKALKP